jgi:putative phosphoesterase
MRVALISDLHSNLAALRAVLRDLPRVERVVCVGDLVGYCAEPNEVIRLVRRKKIEGVGGDHDHAAVTGNPWGLNRVAAEVALWTHRRLTGEGLEYLKALPERLETELGGRRLLVVHGSPRDPLGGRVPPESTSRELAEAVGDAEADVIVFGHTHQPMKRMIFGKLLVNPGSVGQPRDRDPKASYAVLRLGEEVGVDFRRVEYDVENTARVMRANGLPEELAARLFFGW